MTPQAILDRLLALFPDFGPAWDGEHNYFREDDGSFTRCGVFAQFSIFFRDRYAGFTPAQVAQLAALVSVCVDSGDDPLRDAVAACFLENIEGEPGGVAFARHLNGEARRLFDR